MTEYITPTTWEECAAHVEAGGVVEIEDAPGVWINDRAAATTYRGRCGTPDDGWAPRRLVPIESAAPANGVPAVPTGAERYLAERLADPEYRAAYEAAAPVTGDDLRERIAQAIWERDGWGDPWVTAGHLTHTKYRRMADAVLAVLPPQPAPSPATPWPDGVLRDAANRLRWIANSGYIEDPGIKRIIRSWADELDATPVPPWPGAVLSGLTDEDGEPTWLAQAGQVRGEQVRRRSDLVWVNNDQMVAFSDTVWVEVRAPRAVPVPETERVQLGVAVVGGLLAICREGGTLDLGRGDVRIHTENGALVASTSESMFTVEIDPDGTVEVLKDSDR